MTYELFSQLHVIFKSVFSSAQKKTLQCHIRAWSDNFLFLVFLSPSPHPHSCWYLDCLSLVSFNTLQILCSAVLQLAGIQQLSVFTFGIHPEKMRDWRQWKENWTIFLTCFCSWSHTSQTNSVTDFWKCHCSYYDYRGAKTDHVSKFHSSKRCHEGNACTERNSC